MNVSGPPHSRKYKVAVKLEDKILGIGEGFSKKFAEQLAAKAACEKIIEDKKKRAKKGTSKMGNQRKIEFVKLRKTSSISLTGSYCSFNCNHCNGHYLKSMSKFPEMHSLINQGIKSFLISGGLLNDGKIPLRYFQDNLYTLKKTYDLKYNFHTGYIDYEDISYLKKIADVVSYDLIGDKETMINVYGHDFF